MLRNVVHFVYKSLNHLLSGKYYFNSLQQVHMDSKYNLYVLRVLRVTDSCVTISQQNLCCT